MYIDHVFVAVQDSVGAVPVAQFASRLLIFCAGDVADGEVTVALAGALFSGGEGELVALIAVVGAVQGPAMLVMLPLVPLERVRRTDAEVEHGPVDHAAVEAKRAILRGDTTGSAEAA
jgi:hypothetical protein